MAYVGRGLFCRQWLQVVVHRNALGELHQVRALQRLTQFALADENDLQGLVLVGIDVGEHAQLFQCLGRHVLRLVNNQHGAAVVRILVNNKIDQSPVHLDLVHASVFKVERKQYPFQQFTKGAVCVGYQADGMFPIHVVQ